jgi:hypothetical protein
MPGQHPHPRSVEQTVRALLARALADGLVAPVAGRWADPDPHCRSAAELAGVADLLSGALRAARDFASRTGCRLSPEEQDARFLRLDEVPREEDLVDDDEPEPRFEVEAEVVAADGGSDPHYDLRDTFTAEELALVLRKALREGVREMLLRGGREPVGHEVRITIRDAPPGKDGRPSPRPFVGEVADLRVPPGSAQGPGFDHRPPQRWCQLSRNAAHASRPRAGGKGSGGTGCGER